MASNDSNLSPNGAVSGVLRTPSEASRIYEENADLLYAIVRTFLNEPDASNLIHEIAHRLVKAAPEAGYKKYSKLICLHLSAQALRTQENLKTLDNLSLDESMCLLLRDRFGLACKEIGAILGISEGSVRTRLERSRAKRFSTPTDTFTALKTSDHVASEQTNHFCIRTREAIEEWSPLENLTENPLSQITTPSSLVRAISGCEECSTVLRARISSVEYFREQPIYLIPDTLKAFPISPLFVKKGHRFLLNWNAAPWYVKALFEGLLATTLVLGIVLSIPRVKSLYEFWLERRFDLYSVAELAAGLGSKPDEVEPAQVSKNPTPISSVGMLASNASAGNSTTDTSTAPGASAAPDASATPAPHLPSNRLDIKPETEFPGRDIPSSDKVYRILIKTDSPETLRVRVLSAINASHCETGSDAPQTGAELPGGVLFDVFVPFKGYKMLINELASMSETKVIITRAKERGRIGRARLKIWLQRI